MARFCTLVWVCIAGVWVCIAGGILLGTDDLAHAQQWDDGYTYHDGYEVQVDGSGRRLLIDTESGEIVGQLSGNGRIKRLTRREQRRAQRRWNRERKRRWGGRDYSLFDLRRVPDRRRGHRRWSDDSIREDLWTEDGLYDRPGRREYLEDPFEDDLHESTRQARLPNPQQTIEPESRTEPVIRPDLTAQQIARLQIYLDREGFSPGPIDGVWGANVARAVSAWKQTRGADIDLTNARVLDDLFKKSGKNPFASYRITEADVRGPFIARVPTDYSQKARLETLAYTSPAEMLAERFHMSEAYLRKLNPGIRFEMPGTWINVAAPGSTVSTKIHYVIADKSQRQLRALDRNGRLVASYPATIGSASTPSPSGTHSIDRIALNPDYTYNPHKNFKQGNNNRNLRIPPGPNGPVGSVWIALSKPTYGIHGTPNPSTIGKTSSNGCIRLTNWDAQELASLVREGVTVKFVE